MGSFSKNKIKLGFFKSSFFSHGVDIFCPLSQNYGSLDSIEPAKVVVEKDRNVFDAASIISEIDRTMNKFSDNLLHALEGVSARLTQLESRTRHLENSVDDLKLSVGNNHESTQGNMIHLHNILREVPAFFLFPLMCLFF